MNVSFRKHLPSGIDRESPALRIARLSPNAIFQIFSEKGLIFNLNINKLLFIIVFIIESLLVAKLVLLINIFYNLSVIVLTRSSRLISEIFPPDWSLIRIVTFGSTFFCNLTAAVELNDLQTPTSGLDCPF